MEERGGERRREEERRDKERGGEYVTFDGGRGGLFI